MFERKICPIREQVIEDPTSGLTIQFEVAADGTARLRVFGDGLEYGNRDFAFDSRGDLTGRGTALVGPNRPTVLVDLDKL